MQTTTAALFAPVAAALLTLASAGHAQNMSLTRTYSKSFGDSDAGVYTYGTGYIAAGKSTRYVPSSGSGWIVTAPYWETTLAASGSTRAVADLRFLGSSGRAGDFRMNLAAVGTVKTSTLGRLMGTSCYSSGSVYLRVGNSVLWNSSFSTGFSGRSTIRLRFMTPTLTVPVGAGVALLSGRAYGRVRAALDGTFDPCKAKVRFNGEAAVSGNGSASATVISLLMYANLSFSFYANEQKLDANWTTAQPDINATTTWGRSGNLIFHRGAMRGLIKIDAMLPPFIPVSTTLANWSVPYASTRLL